MRRRRDVGSGSVLVLGGIAVLLVVGVSALVLVGVVGATHRARAAADLAALAGAQALVGGAPPRAACSRAATVAGANEGSLRRCRADEGSGVVEVEVTVPVPAGSAGGLGLGHLGPASSRARAGPTPNAAAGPGPGA